MPHRNYWGIALFVCLGFVVFGLHSSAQEKDQPGPQSATAQARRDAAKKAYEGSWEHHVHSPDQLPYDTGHFHDWSVRWMQAKRDLSKTKAEEITAVQEHLKRMEFHKELVVRNVKDELAPAYAASAAEFFCLEAEDWLREAKANAK